jgi:4-hydroxy-2-oxoheptanedioate aldolase
MYPSPLKQKLRQGELVLGTYLPAFNAAIATQSARTGVDFLWIDTEHMPFGAESLETVPVLVRNQGVAPVIRVAWNDPHLIKKAMDVGAVAIMVPQVNTAAEAARAVQSTFYPPLGQRGIAPYWPLVAGENWSNVVRTANDETALLIQIESVEAFQNLEAIAAVPGVDGLVVGPTDLSASVGKITDIQSDEVQRIMEEIPRRLAGSGLVIGTILGDVAEIQQKYRWGYRFLAIGSPLNYGLAVVAEHVKTLRADPRGDQDPIAHGEPLPKS